MRTISILLLVLSSWTIHAQDASRQTYVLKSLVTISNADAKPAIDHLRSSLPEGSTCTINTVKQNITIIGSQIDIPLLMNELKDNGYSFAVKSGPCDDLYKTQIQKEIYISEKSEEYLKATAPKSLIYTQEEFDQFSEAKQARIALSDNVEVK